MNESKQTTHSLGEAQVVAEMVTDSLKVACEKMLVVGSVRRKRPIVHDIDLVVIPFGKTIHKKDGSGHPMPGQSTWFDIPRLIKEILNGTVIKEGDLIITAVVEGIQVDINCAFAENWGIVSLLKTGPKEFNIELCNRARRLGKELKVMSGIWRNGHPLPAETEEEVFSALELEVIVPPARDEMARRLQRGVLV